MNVTFLLEFQQRNIDSSKLFHDCILIFDSFPLENDRVWLSFHQQTLAEMVFCCMPDDQIRFSRRQFQAASEPNGLAACEVCLHTQSRAQKMALRHASLLFSVASMAVWLCSLSCFVRLFVSLEFGTAFQFDLCFQRSFIKWVFEGKNLQMSSSRPLCYQIGQEPPRPKHFFSFFLRKKGSSKNGRCEMTPRWLRSFTKAVPLLGPKACGGFVEVFEWL